MSSRHLVDPELLPILDMMPLVSMSDETLGPMRERIGGMAKMAMQPSDAEIRMDELFAPGRDGAPDVRLLLYRPTNLPPKAPLLIQLHGGGFLFGNAEMGDALHRGWAKELGCAIASVDYRLVPETPYPGPLEDCYAALEWLHGQADELGLDTGRFVLRGDSAGGGLAAGVALLARDRKGPAIRHLMLTYPMLDDRTGSTAPRNPNAGEFVWDAASNAYAWEGMLGQKPGGEVADYAVPGRAKDLAGLPPTFIATVALDIFIDENLDFAKRLIQAGVPCELYVAPGAYHGFEVMTPSAYVSQNFMQKTVDALRRAFAA